MRRRQDQMFTGVYQGTFRFGITSPQHKYQVLPLVAQSLYHGIGKSLPAVVAVRTRFISPHGKYRIHGKNTLFDPTVEITRCRYRLIQILMNLPEYILQRRRYRHTIGHRKTNAVILSGCGIGILPEYDDFYLLERASIENIEKSEEPFGNTSARAYSSGQKRPTARNRACRTLLAAACANSLLFLLSSAIYLKDSNRATSRPVLS